MANGFRWYSITHYNTFVIVGTQSWLTGGDCVDVIHLTTNHIHLAILRVSCEQYILIALEYDFLGNNKLLHSYVFLDLFTYNIAFGIFHKASEHAIDILSQARD